MKTLNPILSAWAAEVVEVAQRNLGATQTVMERNASGLHARKRRRVSTGTLKNSLSFKFTKSSSGGVVRFIAKGHANQYAGVIEYGRRPNSKPPPVAAIEAWMIQKNVRLRSKEGGFIKTTPQGVRSAAYLIARKIGKYGIPGIHYYSEAVQEKLPDLRKSLQKYVETVYKDGD